MASKTHQQPMFGTMHLDLPIDMDYKLVRLAPSIHWFSITTEFRPMYSGVQPFPRG